MYLEPNLVSGLYKFVTRSYNLLIPFVYVQYWYRISTRLSKISSSILEKLDKKLKRYNTLNSTIYILQYLMLNSEIFECFAKIEIKISSVKIVIFSSRVLSDAINNSHFVLLD